MLWFVSTILAVSCSSVFNYMKNRGNDLVDIANIGVEKDVYGFNILLSQNFLGYTFNMKGTGLGIRHGHIGFYQTGDDKNPVVFRDKTGKVLYEQYMGDNFFEYSGYHEPINSENQRANSKKFMVIRADYKLNCSEKNPVYLYYKNRKATCLWWEGGHYFPFELSLGLYLGIRIGFNLGEIFDFVFGIVGFDTMDDDYYNANGTLPKLHGWSARGVTTIISIDEKDLPKPLEKKIGNPKWMR